MAALPAGLLGLEVVVTQLVVGPPIGEPYVDGLNASMPWLVGAFYLAVYGMTAALSLAWARRRRHVAST